MSYIESKVAKNRMNDVLRKAMADSHITEQEAKAIAKELNSLQKVTRSECIKLLRKHGHMDIALVANELVLYDMVTTSTYTTPEQVDDAVVDGIWSAAFPRSNTPEKDLERAFTRIGDSAFNTGHRLAQMKTRTKRNLLWLAITGGTAVIGTLVKLGLIG